MGKLGTRKMSAKEITKRYLMFLIGLFISALGVAITKKGDLGVSPISSVANVLSEKFSFMTIGNWLIIWNIVLIIGQIIILKKKFKPVQLLQIPVSFLFGYFTDFGLWCLSFFQADSYIIKLLLVVIGTFVIAFGIALAVVANTIMNSGEAFVKAISDVTKKQFSNIKIIFDVSCILLALILSLSFFSFSVVGVREGTVIAAFLNGIAIKLYLKPLKAPLERFLTK